MGDCGIRFIDYLKNYYDHSRTASNNVTKFKYLYTFLNNKGINIDELKEENIKPYIELIECDAEFIKTYKKDCKRLLKMYIDWKNGKTYIGNKGTALKITESTPVIAPYAPVSGINITRYFGGAAYLHYSDTDAGSRIRYEETVPDNEKIPGLIPFIAQELYESALEHLEKFSIACDGDINRQLTIILSPLLKKRTYNKSYTTEDLYLLINKYERNGDCEIPTEEILKLLKGTSITTTTDGEYLCDEERKIIYIYYRVLDHSSTEMYLADIRRVLSHELFHAFHHKETGFRFCDSSEEALRVKEALADFYSFTYCLSNWKCLCLWGKNILQASKSIAKNRYELWKKHESTAWPYAYALYLMTIQGRLLAYTEKGGKYRELGCYDKFSIVLNLSGKSMDIAYAYLMGLEDVLNDNASQKNAVGNLTEAFITCKIHDAKKARNEEEFNKLFEENNKNEKDSLAPMYIMEILKLNAGRKYKAAEIQEILCNPPHSMKLKPNAVRRHLNTLAEHVECIWRISDGHNYLYLYSKEKPTGYVTDDEYNEDGYYGVSHFVTD